MRCNDNSFQFEIEFPPENKQTILDQHGSDKVCGQITDHDWEEWVNDSLAIRKLWGVNISKRINFTGVALEQAKFN